MTKEEAIELLKGGREGVAQWNHWRWENPDAKIPSLGSVHLEGANLRRANLEKANLSEAHFERASLVEARLEGANLREAYLKGAKLFRAHLEGTHFLVRHGNRKVPILFRLDLVFDAAVRPCRGFGDGLGVCLSRTRSPASLSLLTGIFYLGAVIFHYPDPSSQSRVRTAAK